MTRNVPLTRALISVSDKTGLIDFARALAARKGPILPLIGTEPDAAHAMLERHVCIDTTASGGNAQLLAEVSGS